MDSRYEQLLSQRGLAGVSVQKIYSRPLEPHTWFDAFETQDERALRARVRAFAYEKLEPLREEVDAKLRCNHLMPLLGEEKLIGTLVPVEHGGEGLGLGSSVVIAQERGGVIPSLASMRAVCGNFVANPLVEFATRQQVDRSDRPIHQTACTSRL